MKFGSFQEEKKRESKDCSERYADPVGLPPICTVEQWPILKYKCFAENP
jgi:hypothetical protein